MFLAERLTIDRPPDIPGVSDLQEFGRSTLVVGYKGMAAGIPTVVEFLLSDDEENRREFYRSSALQSRMSHPGMPPIQKMGVVNSSPIRIREFVEGQPASSLFAEGPLFEDRLTTIGHTLASTLDALHRRGMVHTEVHPHGLRVDTSGLVRFIDTGRAWPMSRLLPKPLRHLAKPYAAPESEEGQVARAESDVYSLAAVLMALASGRPVPAEGVSLDMLEARDTRLSPLFRTLLRAMLELEPQKRPEARTVADALLRVDQLNAYLKLKTWRPAASLDTSLGHHAYPLIGRRGNLQLLLRLWQATTKGKGHSVTLVGPAGSGRRRLVEELRRGVQRTGGAVVRHKLDASAKQPTLILNQSATRDSAPDPDRPWLNISFATKDPGDGHHVIELKPLEADEARRLVEAYLSGTCGDEMMNALSGQMYYPGQLLQQLDDWCEEGVLKPSYGSWRFERFDITPPPPPKTSTKEKSLKAGVSFDADQVLRELMELWPSSLEQDEPVSASLRSFVQVLSGKRADVYRFEGSQTVHAGGSRADQAELNEELLAKLRLRSEPAWDGTSLLLPLRYGVVPAGLICFQWSKASRPEFDPAFLNCLIASTAPYALWLGKTRR